MEYIKKILNSMEKFVYENLDEFLNERFVEDPEADGSYEESFPEDGEETEEIEDEIEDEEIEESPEEEEVEKEMEEETSSKKGFHENIEDSTLENENFRRVLYTGENLQLVVMTLQEGEEVGEEIHENDQFFRFEEGEGICIINDNEYEVEDGSGVIVPAGSKHNIINIGEGPLKLDTLYSPPHHKDGVKYASKEEAEESSEEFDGETTE